MNTAGEVTVLLQRAESGDRAAAEDLYRLVESDLRAIAGNRKKRFENPLENSTTVLVDEAFVRLVGGDVTVWRAGDRGKFYSYAARKIHDLLVESARSRRAQKRGGDRLKVDLDALEPAAADDADFVIDLHDALARFDRFAPVEARAFRLYYFLGSTFDETAALLGVSPTESKRLCRKAQLWLQRELKDYCHEP